MFNSIIKQLLFSDYGMVDAHDFIYGICLIIGICAFVAWIWIECCPKPNRIRPGLNNYGIARRCDL